MNIGKSINKIRVGAGLSQEQFAEIFGVSQQSVQKWETGASTPELSKIVEISKHFGVSLDELVLERDKRMMEEVQSSKCVMPEYSKLPWWESYGKNACTEYRQAIDEGLDVENYKNLFDAITALPKDEIQNDLSEIVYKIISSAKIKKGYKYIEPSDLESIKDLRKNDSAAENFNKSSLENKISGAWYGRISGCMLGKTVECIKTDELVPFLKETGNFPMHRYIYESDLTDEICEKYKFPFRSRAYADNIDGMPVDDDTNYVVLAQIIVDKYGKDFTPYDVSRAWLDYQKKDAYCTAERIAYINFVNGFEPPKSAVYKNPYREWIGAQIRGDYFGYINPGNPEKAAEMAWRDASISHTKNGIYGEMFVSAMIAKAAVTNSIEEIILAGLSQIPYTSRLYEEIMRVLEEYKNSVTKNECFKNIHEKYNEFSGYDWCHTISNAVIVAASLLYGNGDFAKSICMAVETGFDTDCNGATVGSILGMANGIESIPEYWVNPFNNKLNTTIFGVGTVNISDRVKLTLKHINN